eukprot:4306522-Amphidinium_carterae.1
MRRLGGRLYTELTHHRILGWQAQATRRRYTKIQRTRFKGAAKRMQRLRIIVRFGKERKYAKYLRTNIQPTALWGSAIGGIAPGPLCKMQHQHARIATRLNAKSHPPDGLRALAKSDYDPGHQHHRAMMRLWHSVLSAKVVGTEIWSTAVIGASDELRRCTSPWGGGCPVRSFLTTLTRLGIALESEDTITYAGHRYSAHSYGIKEYVGLGHHASLGWSDHLAGRRNRAWQGINDAAAKAEPQQKYYIVQAAAQGIWSSTDYDSHELCALCGLEPATQHHRLLRCPRWAKLRLDGHAPQAYNYLRQRHSAEEVVHFNCTKIPLPEVEEPPLLEKYRPLQNEIGYVDGSAFYPQKPECRRASFAWATVAQRETLALARLLEETSGDITIYSGCLGVINIWKRGRPYLDTGQVRYASLWKRIWEAALDRNVELLKVAAHQKEPNKSDPAWAVWAGNDLVDRLSKETLRQEEINPNYKRAYLEGCAMKALLNLHGSIMTAMAQSEEWDYPWWANHKNNEPERHGLRHWQPPDWLLQWANQIDNIDRGNAPAAVSQQPTSGTARGRQRLGMWGICKQGIAIAAARMWSHTSSGNSTGGPALSRLRRGLHPQTRTGHIEGMRQVSIEEAYAILRTTITQGRGGPRPDFQL